MRITVSQMPDDPAEFERQWDRLVRHLRNTSSDVVLLPEMPFFSWFCAAPKFNSGEWLRAVREHRKWLRRLDELDAPVVIGSAPVEREGRRVNEGFAWTKKQGAKGVHLKDHLPNEPGYWEATWYSRGGKPFVPFEISGWKAGMLICSDLWSMADARGYGKKGAGLIVVPRCTGDKSVDKWVAGGRVASVVSGAYSASSNRVGIRGEASFGGHGWVTDPDGNVLGLTSASKPFLTVTIDKAKASRAKTTYPRDSLEPD